MDRKIGYDSGREAGRWRERISPPNRSLAKCAEQISFWARWGNASGMPFVAEDFLTQHIQWDYLDGYLNDRPTRPWLQFTAGQEQ
jgi:hypothetical protein